MAMLLRLLPSWLSNDSSATAEALVKERNDGLINNTEKIDDIVCLKERLRVCFEAVKTANPTLAATLNPSQEAITEKEMGEQLKILALATLTDLSGLRQDLEEVRKKREQLIQLLEIWERIEAHFDTALEKGGKALTMDEKNIQNLTELRGMVQNAGVLPTCHSDSTHL